MPRTKKQKISAEGEGVWDDVKKYALPAALGALGTLGTASHLYNEYQSAKANKDINKTIEAANERSKKHFGLGRKKKDVERMVGGVKNYSLKSLGARGAEGDGFFDDLKNVATNHIIPAAKAIIPLAIGVHKAYNDLKDNKVPSRLQ